MGLVDNVTSRLFGPVIERYLARKAAGEFPAWALAGAEYDRWTMPPLVLPQKQAELYQRLSWVAIAVGHVGKEVAGVPLAVKREVGEETEDIPNHPFELLLKRPSPIRSRYEFLEATVLYYLLTGNAYWWLNKASESAPPDEMFIIPSHRIEPVPDGRMYLKGYLYDSGNGVKIPLDTSEIVHFRRFNPFNPFVGMSPVEAIATIAVGDLKMQEWNTKFFGENNGRIPGALAFSDPIPDPEWERMKEEFRETALKRNMLLLRNTGQGGVNWVQMAMTQKDMEFLAARRFNQSEIYDLFAPGLTQWLSPDTTNANARAGRDAFFELGVFPMHVAIAETVSNSILPLYGDNLVAEFEDVRPKDRALMLQEQQAFAQVHTLDEIRERYYQAAPIGDERGLKLLKEISGSSGGGGAAFDTGLPGVDIVEPVQPEGDEDAKAKERAQFRVFAAKRLDEGKPEKINGFTFYHLDESEQRALKAEYEPDGTAVLADRLALVIDELRKVRDVETEAEATV